MSMTAFSKTRSRPFALLLLAALTSFAAACGDDNKATSPTNEFGSYTLRTVNGQSLPFTLTGTSRGTVVVQSGSINLSTATSTSSGKPVYLAGVSGTANGQAQQLVTDNGTYTLTGTSVTFSSSVIPTVQYAGVISGNTLTLTLPGLLFGTSGTIVLAMQR
jgi:hypothetical protein